MTNTIKETKPEIGYAWGLGAEIGNGCQLSVSFNMEKGVDAVNMNAQVDALVAVFNRQQAKAASIAVAQQIGEYEQKVEFAAGDLVRLNEKESAKGSLSAQERQQKEAAEAHLEKMQKDLERKKGVLEQLKDEAK